MRTRLIPLLMSLAWFGLAFAILGLSYWSLTANQTSGWWWGGLTVSAILALTGLLWLFAALTGWVRWSPARVRVRSRS